MYVRPANGQVTKQSSAVRESQMTLRAVKTALCGAEILPPQIYNSNNNERPQSGIDDCHREGLAEGFEKHLTDENVKEQVRREGGYSAGSGRDFPKFIPAKTDSRNPDEHFEQSEMSRDAVHSCREVTISEYSGTFVNTSTTCHEQPVDEEAIVQVDDVG